MWTSGHIEYKFLVDKAIAVLVDPSDNAFDTHTGGVRFESQPRIDCPVILFIFFSVHQGKL